MNKIVLSLAVATELAMPLATQADTIPHDNQNVISLGIKALF